MLIFAKGKLPDTRCIVDFQAYFLPGHDKREQDTKEIRTWVGEVKGPADVHEIGLVVSKGHSTVHRDRFLPGENPSRPVLIALEPGTIITAGVTLVYRTMPSILFAVAGIVDPFCNDTPFPTNSSDDPVVGISMMGVRLITKEEAAIRSTMRHLTDKFGAKAIDTTWGKMNR